MRAVFQRSAAYAEQSIFFIMQPYSDPIQKVLEFQTIWPDRFHEDAVVVRHELGHALTWHLLGGEVELIRFVRCSSGDLAGGMKMVPPATGSLEDLKDLWNKNPKELACRLLAGEIAARRYLNLPPQEVCSDFSVSPGTSLSVVLSGREGDMNDLTKALSLANDAAGDKWYSWLVERHQETQSLVSAQWPTINRIADQLVEGLPVYPEDNELSITGSYLLAML